MSSLSPVLRTERQTLVYSICIALRGSILYSFAYLQIDRTEL